MRLTPKRYGLKRQKDKIPCQDGDEYDFLTWCKKYFSFRPGERKRLKRKYNKRLRKEFKHLVDKTLDGQDVY